MIKKLAIDRSTFKIPTLAESEAGLAEKASDALKVLTDRNGLDLIDILGLRPYVESKDNESDYEPAERKET